MRSVVPSWSFKLVISPLKALTSLQSSDFTVWGFFVGFVLFFSPVRVMPMQSSELLFNRTALKTLIKHQFGKCRSRVAKAIMVNSCFQCAHSMLWPDITNLSQPRGQTSRINHSPEARHHASIYHSTESLSTHFRAAIPKGLELT